MKLPVLIAILWGASFHAPTASALENFFNVTAITLQQGDEFQVGDSRRTIATLEHYGLWDWGDVYTFYDRIREDSSSRVSYYAELSPRVSFSILGVDARSALFKDVLLATTLEKGSSGFEAYLIGPGLTWDLSPFAHLESNLYFRDTKGLQGSTWQLTLAWVLPFTTGPLHWQFDGYMDLRGAEGSATGDLNFNPQLKLDLGAPFGNAGHFFAGVEYYHWNNKFGIEGVNERVVSPLLQVQFGL
jgi:nucleoside-specific outer membrane channel protein Tsx